MENIKAKLVKEAQRVEEDSLQSSKRHFVTAAFWTNFHLWVGIPTAILSGIAGASALSHFDHHNVVAGILAITVAALTAVTTFLNPTQKAGSHMDAGNKYNALRNAARIFREIDCHETSSDRDLSKRLKELTKQRDELNQKSPITPRWAFEKARKGIEEGEAEYKVDKSDNSTQQEP
jgi:hypothetical protein